METSKASIGCWAVASRYYWPMSLMGPKSPGNTSRSRICFNTGKDVIRRSVAEYWWNQTTWLKEITYKVVFNNCLCLEQASKSWILLTQSLNEAAKMFSFSTVPFPMFYLSLVFDFFQHQSFIYSTSVDLNGLWIKLQVTISPLFE